MARPFRRLLLPAVLLLLLIFIISHGKRATEHVLQPSLFSPHSSVTANTVEEDVSSAAVCKSHGFSPFHRHGERPRRVYDLFLIATELAWLEIRLHTLAPYVDYFVIVEAPRTFTNLPKPLYLKENWDLFADFHHKMLHFVVQDEVVSNRTWDHEDFFRNAMLDKAFPSLVGTEREATEGDAIIVSDIDEIPKPETVMLLRQCDYPDRLTLRSHFYYYSFQWLHRGQQWAHPHATQYHGLDGTISTKDLRNGEGGSGWLIFRPLQRWWQRADLYDSAWHCSWCFATIAQMQNKMASSSHTPWNTDENRDPKTIVGRVRHGLDIFNREDQIYDKVESNRNVPEYVFGNGERFRHILNRDGEDAAFVDFQQQVV